MRTHETLRTPVSGLVAEAADQTPAAGLRAVLARQPIAAVLAIFTGLLVFNTSSGLALKALAPDLPKLVPDFIVLCLNALAIAALLTWLGWWREVGYTAPTAWRHLSLLGLPVVLVVVLPFVRGVDTAEAGSFFFLALGYLLTGFNEESWWRGLVVRVLRPVGVTRTVTLAGVLFGMLHLGNLVYRANPALVMGQMVGAACFGFAYAALRLRTNTVWFLIPLHMLNDLFLHYTNLPTIPLEVGRDVVLLGFGLYLLRALRAEERAAAGPRGGR